MSGVGQPRNFTLETTQTNMLVPVTSKAKPFQWDDHYDFPRDMVGYGEKSLNPQWPNNAKIAVSFVINYEEVGLP